MSTDDVVVTMVGTLGVQVASRFARSLRETGAQCDLVLLLPASTSSERLVASLAEWRASPHYYATTATSYAALRGNRQKLVRYHAALEYLQQRQTTTGRVLLADSRDVIFQRDPFTIPPDPSRPLDVFMEDYLRDFANSGINQGHVVPCFGSEAVKRALLSPPRAVSCSGVTLGTHAAVLAYLKAMWSEMSQPRYSAQCLQHDQAFHNWLLWTGRLSDAVGARGVRAFSNEEGPVTTIGWPQHLYRDRFGRVLNRRGELVHLVHQYDRRKRLLASLGQRYALIAAPEAPPRTMAPVDTTAALRRGTPSAGDGGPRRTSPKGGRALAALEIDAAQAARPGGKATIASSSSRSSSLPAGHTALRNESWVGIRCCREIASHHLHSRSVRPRAPNARDREMNDMCVSCLSNALLRWQRR